MASNQEVAARWATEVGKDNPRFLLRHGSIFVDGDRIYSYGRHFELGRLIGKNRASGFFLLNGDRYSTTTSGHQSTLRAVIAKTGIPSVIIPYTALHAAGIVKDSMRPLDAQPERTDSWQEDVGPAWTIDRQYSPEEGSLIVREITGSLDRGGIAQYRAREYRRNFGSSVHAVETLRGWCHGGWRDYEPGEKVTFYDSRGNEIAVEDGRFKTTRYRHFLGACLFTAETNGRRRKFLSAFDDNERRPLYFLCELPRCNAKTYEEAIDALAPRIVHSALAQGREVSRQGDVFAIPTELDRKTLRARGARFAKRVPLLDTNHASTETAFIGRAVYARGCMYHDVVFRERDHARIKLGDGKTWHLVVRNTVPRSRANRRGAQRLNA